MRAVRLANPKSITISDDEGCGNNIAGTSGAMGADGVMQRLLHVGSFPMAPIDGNDHSIQPTDYLSQHVALEECSDTNPAQLWTRSRSDLLHGSFVSSPAAGSVCLTPYDTNVSALKPGTAEAVAAVWLCCGNGTEHSCGSWSITSFRSLCQLLARLPQQIRSTSSV